MDLVRGIKTFEVNSWTSNGGLGGGSEVKQNGEVHINLDQITYMSERIINCQTWQVGNILTEDEFHALYITLSCGNGFMVNFNDLKERLGL